MSLTLSLPWPPTVNTMYATVHGRRVLSRKGRLYRGAVRASLLENRSFVRVALGQARLAVAIDAYPPDKRKRDLDNLLKAIFDSLRYCGVYDDDSQIDDIAIQRCGIKKQGCIDITLWPITEKVKTEAMILADMRNRALIEFNLET